MEKQSGQAVKMTVKKIAKYKTVFLSKDGQDVLRDLIKSNYVLCSTFDSSNDSMTLLREGQRNAILRILTILKIDEKKLLEQIHEEDSYA